MSEIYTGADGFLFIGDPHVSSKKPGRRTDKNYMGTSLAKLEEALLRANNLNLVPIILGDLTDEPQDTHPLMLVHLVRMFKNARHTPICLVGNHDCHELSLTPDTVLAILREAEVLHVVDTAGPMGLFQFESELVGLGASPYGHAVPSDVEGMFPDGVSQVIWMTHADWAFEGAYPGSQPLSAINGCTLMVNGHMHRTMPLVHLPWMVSGDRKKGETQFFNPGNLIRQSTADAQHIPSAWEWRPEFMECVRHTMTHEADPFDWTGLQIKPMAEGAMAGMKTHETDFIGVLESSRFVSGLKAELSSEMPKSQGADILLEDLNDLLASGTYDPDVTTVLHDIFASCFGSAPKKQENIA
jgi:hypothetical protein